MHSQPIERNKKMHPMIICFDLCQFRIRIISHNEEALECLVLRICSIFGSVFRFSHFKTKVFRFWCLGRFAGFLQLI